jgi:hypothetical protein
MSEKVSSPLASLLIVVSLLVATASASAQDSQPHRFGAGGHFGIGLDDGSPMLGGDFLVDVLQLSDRVTMSLWPRYTHVFLEDALDVNLLELHVPFQFHMPRPVVRPYAAPGLGLAFGGGTSLKLNLVGGCLFRINDRFEPYTQLVVRMINGTYVDLQVGMLVRF